MIFNIREQENAISEFDKNRIFDKKDSEVVNKEIEKDIEASEFGRVLEAMVQTRDAVSDNKIKVLVDGFVSSLTTMYDDLIKYKEAYVGQDPIPSDNVDSITTEPYYDYTNIIHSTSLLSFKSELNFLSSNEGDVDTNYRKIIMTKCLNMDIDPSSVDNTKYIETLYNFFRKPVVSGIISVESMSNMIKDYNSGYNVYIGMVAYDINNAKTNAIKFCFDMNKRGLSNDENICARLEDLLHVYSLLLAARVDAIKEYIKFSSELLNTYKESINEGVIRDYLSFIKSEISKRKYLKLVAINKSQLEKWEKKLEKREKKVPKNKELIAVFKSNNPSNKDMSDIIKAMNTEANRRFAEDNMRLSFQQMQLQNDTATYCCVMSPSIGMSHSIGMM